MMRVDGDDGGSGSGAGDVDDAVVKPPGWLEGLMRETFFGGCVRHQYQRRKKEKNIFCLHCCVSFCLHCLPSHPSNHHPLLQVRRYVYHDVVRLEDMEKLIDCSYIQGYTINGAKVIFLNERARSSGSGSRSGSRSSSTPSCSSKLGGPAGNFCLTCCRILQDPYLFCSLSCKVDYMVYQREDLSSIISCRFDASDHDLHDDMGCHDVSNNNNNSECEEEDEDDDGFRAGGKKKKKNKGRSGRFMMMPGNGMVLPQQQHQQSISNRRKGAPTRSPLS